MIKNINKVVLGLAMALPSTILGAMVLLYQLVGKNIISENVALVLLLLIIVNTFYLMLRYVIKRKN